MITPLPIKELVPGKSLNTPIFLEDGRLLLAAGAKVKNRHIAVLKRAGIERVLACDRELEGFALGEPATSRPVEVRNLKIGSIIQLPLYTEEGMLLLSQGSIFTADYSQALARGGITRVFARGRETLLPDVEYIQAVAEALATDCDQLVGRHDSHVFGPLSGPGWAQDINQPFLERRVPELISGALSNYEDKIYMVEDLFSRIIRNGRVQEQDLFDTAENMMNNVRQDKALSVGLTTVARRENHFLFRHSLNTALFSATIGATLGMDQNQVTELVVAAIVEDIGMMVVPQTILNLARPLSQSEKNMVSRHVLNSLGLQADLDTLPESVRLAVYQHHERDNASGYPKKTPARDICPYSKVLAVADTYSALTSKRPYRNPQPQYKAMESLIRMAGQGTLSRDCVKAFLSALSLFPIGSFVRLSNKRIGQVIAAGENYTQPVVRVLFDETQKPLAKDYIVNLEEQPDQSVVGISTAEELYTQPLAGF